MAKGVQIRQMWRPIATNNKKAPAMLQRLLIKSAALKTCYVEMRIGREA